MQQHKAAVKEIVEGQKSKEGEGSNQPENPQASPEAENKHDASTNTQVPPENSQPDLQEVKNKTDSDSPTQNLESTNVVPASLSSEISTTPAPHDKPAPQDKGNITHGHTDDHDQKTALQVSDSTTKNGDIQQENSHTPSNSQQQDPLREGQSVAKDTKSTGNIQAPQMGNNTIKNTSGMITRSQSAATRINTSTSTDSSDTLPQNANLKQKNKHGLDEETSNPKCQKTFATSDASSSCSSTSPKMPSTPMQETTPGGGSLAGQVGIVYLWNDGIYNLLRRLIS